MSQFGLRSSPNNPQTSPIPSELNQSTSSQANMAVTRTTPAAPGTPPPNAGQRCCDTGRPIFTDPITGQSICSCQYELLGYQRIAAGGVSGLPTLSMYSTPYADGVTAYFPTLGAEQAPFYSPTATGLEIKEGLAAGATTWPYPSVYHPYDTPFSSYPFNGYGVDLNGARRKNATRETTSTLKAWLNEHKKNPYPTKGEKIMLAIITKMTLTQVSTWFANARRRLKKENKMTWEPRNRVDDEDNNNDDDDHKSADGRDVLDSKDSGTASSEDGDRPALNQLGGPEAAGEWSESRRDSETDSPDCFDRPLHQHNSFLSARASRLPTTIPQMSATASVKPRIWSLADMASKKNESGLPTQPFIAADNVAGRLMHNIAGRIPGIHTPFVRPQDFYRSLYATSHHHLAGCSASTSEPASMLDTCSRTLQSSHASTVMPTSLSSVFTMANNITSGAASNVTPISRYSPSSNSSLSSGSETPIKAVGVSKV